MKAFINGNTEILTGMTGEDCDDVALEAVEAAVRIFEDAGVEYEVDSDYSSWRGGRHYQFAKMKVGHVCTWDDPDEDDVVLLDAAGNAMFVVLEDS